MATGNTLDIFTPYNIEVPPTGYATFGVRGDHPVALFDQITPESGFFSSVLPRHYSAGGITSQVIWTSSLTAGTCVWSLSVERMPDGTGVLQTQAFNGPQIGSGIMPDTAGTPKYTNIVFTNSQIDGLLIGEAYRLNLKREASRGEDTLAGDAEFIMLELKET